MQQYADIYLQQSHSTCFGCPQHPSLGVLKTVTAASGTGHNIGTSGTGRDLATMGNALLILSTTVQTTHFTNLLLVTELFCFDIYLSRMEFFIENPIPLQEILFYFYCFKYLPH